MKKLLIVTHAPSENTKNIAQVMELGAQKAQSKIIVSRLSPFKVDASAIAKADGVLLMTTENFGYMSGALKDMFDRTYYDILDTKRGLPYALVVRAGKDGTGTVRAVESITKGLGWRKVQEALIQRGDFKSDFLPQARELSEAFALALAEGMI